MLTVLFEIYNKHIKLYILFNKCITRGIYLDNKEISKTVELKI